MISAITGMVIGITAGTIIGEGMDITKDIKGRRKITALDLKRGYNKAKETVIPVATTSLAILGAALLVESTGEWIEYKREEEREYCKNKKEELLVKTDDVFDRFANELIEKETDRYIEASDMIGLYNTTEENGFQLGEHSIYAGNKRLSSIEAWGLLNMTDSDIREAIEIDTDRFISETKDELKGIIERTGTSYGLEILDNSLDYIDCYGDLLGADYESINADDLVDVYHF